MSSHSLSRTLTGISLTLNATPAVPTPLFVVCPIVPLTWVPWPSRSIGRSVFQMKSCGATNRLDGPSSGAATKSSVRSPSDGYSTPVVPPTTTSPSASIRKAFAW